VDNVLIVDIFAANKCNGAALFARRTNYRRCKPVECGVAKTGRVISCM
jgi:hypothetical protein